MRFCELKGLEDRVASSLIAKSPYVELRDVLEKPGKFKGKKLVFRGNYDNFDTNRLCTRTFEYLPGEDRWKVEDVTVYDLFVSSFDYHFSKQELEERFEAFCNSKGFVMDV